MQKEKKLTDADIKYYMSGCNDIEFTSDDADKVDSDRMDAIPKMAQADVLAGDKKRDKGSFKNDSEYKLYLLSVYDVAGCIKDGLM